MAIPCCQDALSPLLTRLLDWLTISLAECGRPACRYTISTDAPGTEAWDLCCDCATGVGMAYVAVESITPDPSPGYQNGSLVSCATEQLAVLQVGVLRCAPVMDNSAQPPTAASLTAAALGALADSAIIRQAIRCSFASDDPEHAPDTVDASSVTLGPWLPLGPQGGCLGGQQQLTVRFFDYRCS